MHRVKLLEGIGLAVLLMAAGWQVFLEDLAKAQASSARLYHIERKLEVMWAWESYTSQIETDSHRRANAVHDLDKRFAEGGRIDNENWSRQAATLTQIRAALYLLGSLLLVGGKYMEYRLLKSQTQPIAADSTPAVPASPSSLAPPMTSAEPPFVRPT